MIRKQTTNQNAAHHEEIREGGIQGLLTQVPNATWGFVYAHGAGGNARTPFLEKVAVALAAHGVETLRIDLPFRQKGSGPPRPSQAAADRQGIAEAIQWMRRRHPRVAAGGHSYGGRQTSMLAAEDPKAVDALLFTSYPLHPPGKPDSLRTEHWPRIATPAFFVHGTKDPFGSIEELRLAMQALKPPHELFVAEAQGHSLAKLDFAGHFAAFLLKQ
jgi:predicted alpha/beta-hydrolase family hydrolase